MSRPVMPLRRWSLRLQPLVLVALLSLVPLGLVAWGLERQVHQVDEEEKVEDDGGRAQPHGHTKT